MEQTPPSKPAILTVDDDPEVLRAIERDLRKQYASSYRIIRSDSGQAALETLTELKKRNDDLALMLVDQRMPRMNGVTFLSEAIKIYPDAKRAMLTAYADTDAAIAAINDAKIQHYFMKPWHPPEQNLYPVLNAMLEDWKTDYVPPFRGLKLLGNRWAPKSYELRDFLARNRIYYKWMDAETAHRDPEVKEAMEAIGDDIHDLPVLLFPEGDRLKQPSMVELAQRLGLKTQAQMKSYDVVIVGAGPAGLAAAVYGASEGLNTVLIEREAPGGQAGLSSRIENYLGFPAGLTGGDLAMRAVNQATRFGVEIISPQEVTGLRAEGAYRTVILGDGSELSCRAVLLAMGVQWRKLEIPGIDKLQGAGVYYGAGSTEAMTCVDEQVYIVGGANSAGQAAMYFSKYAKEVVMLVRGPSLAASMSHYLIEQIEKTPNIRLDFHTSVVEVHGEERLAEISILCSVGNETTRVPASSLFIFIGAMPKTDWLEGIVERDEKGFILSGTELKRNGKMPAGWNLPRDPGLLETSMPGIFVVGDVRKGSVKRVASGVGEGSIAIQFVHQYLGNV